MLIFSTLVSLAGLSAALFQAGTRGWEVHSATATGGEVLTFAADAPVSYRFECTACEVIVTQTGVTKLMNLQSGDQIDDGPNAVMPANEAMMAVFAGEGQPQFRPATAVKNPAPGWDLTISLRKNDTQLKAVGKGEMMSLFTTGHTMSIAMNANDRKIWNGFLERCQMAN